MRKSWAMPTNGVIDRHIAVRVIVAEHVAHDDGRFAEFRRGSQTLFMHGVQDAAMHRLQPVAHVGQGAGRDDGHGVVQVRLAHLGRDVAVDDAERYVARHRRGLLFYWLFVGLFWHKIKKL